MGQWPGQELQYDEKYPQSRNEFLNASTSASKGAWDKGTYTELEGAMGQKVSEESWYGEESQADMIERYRREHPQKDQ